MTNDLHYKTISELAPLIRDGVLSSIELTESQLERIDRIDGQLKAYAMVMADSARAQARAADGEIAAGNYRGPLHGIPVAVKDLCATDGVRTMGGSAVFADNVPEFDSTVVLRSVVFERSERAWLDGRECHRIQHGTVANQTVGPMFVDHLRPKHG